MGNCSGFFFIFFCSQRATLCDCKNGKKFYIMCAETGNSIIRPPTQDTPIQTPPANLGLPYSVSFMQSH